MNTLMLSSKCYKESKEHDFGDCFTLDNGNDVVVFDCGCSYANLSVGHDQYR